MDSIKEKDGRQGTLQFARAARSGKISPPKVRREARASSRSPAGQESTPEPSADQRTAGAALSGSEKAVTAPSGGKSRWSSLQSGEQTTVQRVAWGASFSPRRR